jgi:predicted Zn-dependent peptidase
MREVHSVALGFWVASGSRDESDGQAGASHFLEHLLFKGTADRSAAAIAEELDRVGGDCNAFTTKEYTAFYVRLLAEHLPLGLDILSDIMWVPALAPADVDAERTVILDEISMHADEPSDLAAERWQAALFPGHPLGRDTLGTPSSVRGLDASDIRAFFERHYLPSNIVVAAAGAFEHDSLAEAIDCRYRGPGGGSAPTRRPPRAAGAAPAVVHRPTEQAHLVLGTRSVSRTAEDRWAYAVLNQVLGGGMSSRLFQKVREERGLAYSIWSERAAYEETGSLSVSVGTAPEHVGDVLGIVAAELEALASSGVSDRELDVARGSLRAELLLAGEDSGSRMARLATALLLHGEVPTPAELVARVEAVGSEDVRRAAEQVASTPWALAGVGPLAADVFDGWAPGSAGHAA